MFNINVHGGTISHRHKLSLNEFRLSKFLNLINYNLSKREFYLYYRENLFSKNTYDTHLYSQFKKLVSSNLLHSDDYKGLIHSNKEYLEFLREEKVIYLSVNVSIMIRDLTEIKDKIETYELRIEEFSSEIKNKNRDLNFIMNRIRKTESKLSPDYSKRFSSKHIHNIKNKLQQFKSDHSDLLSEIKQLFIDKSQFIKSFVLILEKVNTLLRDLDRNLSEFNLIINLNREDEVKNFKEKKVDRDFIKDYYQVEGFSKLNKILDDVKKEVLEAENKFQERSRSRSRSRKSGLLSLNNDNDNLKSISKANKKRFYSNTVLSGLSPLFKFQSSHLSLSLRDHRGMLGVSLHPFLWRDIVGLHLKGISSIHVRTMISSSSSRGGFQIDSPNYLELKRILSSNPLNEETQVKIERYLFNQGQLVLDEKFNDIKDINYNKLNKKIISELKDFSSIIHFKLNNLKSDLNMKKIDKITDPEYITLIKDILSYLNNNIIISILLGRILKIISNYNLVNKNTIFLDVVLDIAKDVLNNYLSKEYENYKHESKEKLGFSEFITKTHLKRYTKDSTFLFYLGNIFIGILLDIELVFMEVKRLKRDEKVSLLVPRESLRFDSAKFKLIDLPYKIPMIVPPKEYSIDPISKKERVGGYYLNDITYSSPLIIENKYLRESSTISDVGSIYTMVNVLSKVGFKINTQVLDFILENSHKYNLLVDYKSIETLENEKNELIKLQKFIKVTKGNGRRVVDGIHGDDKKNVSLIENNCNETISNEKSSINNLNNSNTEMENPRVIAAKILKISKELESLISKYRLDLNVLGLAQLFRNIPEFYIPIRIDIRGRVYCMVEYLNYQGKELAKSLLLFSKGEKVYKSNNTSINYFKVFGANCYGHKLSKSSFKDKVQWVNENELDILNFKNGKLISEAENKLLFISFCFEYLNYSNSLLNEDTYYYTHFPIQLDATCNGYQHLALLIGDDSLGHEVNITQSDSSDKLKDFYGFIGLKLKSYFKEKILTLTSDNNHEELKDLDSYERLECIDLHRKLVKVPIMVKPYNATLFRSAQYVKEQFSEE